MGGEGSEQGEWTGPQPVMILVRPQLGENIGAAARAMWNFGLEHMRLVAPRDGWPNTAAAATASGAGRVLDAVRVAPDTAHSIADLEYVYATTARPREMTKPVLTPEAAMADARARIAAGARVGVLFGPERAGLENDDIVPANAIVSVPVNPAFASLNVAQCVLLVAYEWGKGTQPVPGPRTGYGRAANPRPARQEEVARLADSLIARLDGANFFFPEHKRDSMTRNLRNLLHRADLTDPDVRTLYGVFRTLAERTPRE